MQVGGAWRWWQEEERVVTEAAIHEKEVAVWVMEWV